VPDNSVIINLTCFPVVVIVFEETASYDCIVDLNVIPVNPPISVESI
jgi:hypothetical protein